MSPERAFRREKAVDGSWESFLRKSRASTGSHRKKTQYLSFLTGKKNKHHKKGLCRVSTATVNASFEKSGGSLNPDHPGCRPIRTILGKK
jgi:hypothetical protein